MVFNLMKWIMGILMEMGWYVLIHVNSSVEEARKIISDFSSSNGNVSCGDVVTGNLLVDSDVDRLIADVINHPAVIDSNGLSGLIHNASKSIDTLTRLAMDKLNLKTQILNKGEIILNNKEIIIINSFGVLNDYFKYAKSVFIGKSTLEKLKEVGGQNPIDAANFGCRIYHGSCTRCTD